jgi:hypothetical protein
MVLYSHSHQHSVFGGHGFSYAMRHACPPKPLEGRSLGAGGWRRQALCDFSFALVGGAMPAIGSLEDVEIESWGECEVR